METVEVEITGQAITAQYGTLNTGDILRTSAEFAKHLVEGCSAAKYRGAGNIEAAAPVDLGNKPLSSEDRTQPLAPAKTASTPKPGKGKQSKAG